MMKSFGVVGLTVGLVLLASSVSARQENDARFMGVNSIFTNYEIVNVTLTEYLSCSSQIVTDPCKGRRRKRSVPIKITPDSGNDELESGLESTAKTDGTSSDKSEKLLFTMWSTTNVKTSITAITTDTRTTVSISYLCSVAPSERVVYQPAC